jgi:hypothetical protein
MAEVTSTADIMKHQTNPDQKKAAKRDNGRRA